MLTGVNGARAQPVGGFGFFGHGSILIGVIRLDNRAAWACLEKHLPVIPAKAGMTGRSGYFMGKTILASCQSYR
ncbi:MAG: hypothetical protein ACYCZD_03565 [Rhodanobacter sp.]